MPTISVILPVYNAERFLKEAIDSILQQTFSDFELLLINDGSTDGSEQIIASYTDPRIVYIKNEKNEGLIYSLNKAIDLARGRYIARMDADDVSLPQRFEKQLRYLEEHNVAVLGTRVQLIDEDGNLLPDWKDDVNNMTASQIREFMLTDNCIAHPSVMVQTLLFKSYKFQHNQKYSEDYDLWLRMLADGLVIEKLREALLLHRILPTSATRFKKINVYYRLAKVKFRFFAAGIKRGKAGGFAFKVFLFALIDVLKAGVKEVKAFFAR